MFRWAVCSAFTGALWWLTASQTVLARTVNNAVTSAVTNQVKNTVTNQTAGTNQVVGSGFTNSTAGLAGIGTNPVWDALKLLVSLGILIVLVVLTIRFLAKRSGLSASQGEIRVLAARQISPGKSVQVIEVYGSRLLIGVGEQVTVLATLENTTDTSDSFAELLTESLKELRGGRTKGESTEP